MVEPGAIALTALMLACGCEPEYLDEVKDTLGRTDVAETHQGRYDQVTKAITKVRKKHS